MVSASGSGTLVAQGRTSSTSCGKRTSASTPSSTDTGFGNGLRPLTAW